MTKQHQYKLGAFGLLRQKQTWVSFRGLFVYICIQVHINVQNLFQQSQFGKKSEYTADNYAVEKGKVKHNLFWMFAVSKLK